MCNRYSVIATVALIFAAGCGDEGKSFDQDELVQLTGLEEKSETFTGKVTVVGTLTYGQTSSAVSYTRTPKYRAFKFVGKTGDAIDVWVRARGGDAVAWLTDSTFKTLATNDDADASTTDARVTATLPAGVNATYYIVFREYAQGSATFTVSLKGGTTTTPPPVSSQSTLIGNGRAGSASLVRIYQQDRASKPTALAFHPLRPSELWMVNYADDTVVTLYNPGRSNQRALRRLDPAASHFMHYPTTLAFGAGDTFATCGDGNNGGNDFMGPALFSADPDIFAVPTRGGLGSHLDMLHYSPYCMGMAHESANVYWAFDSYHGALMKYDFARDHGPGRDDHSDGVIRVYVAGQMRGVRGVPSHLAFDARTSKLYAADTGNGRIVALDTRSGTLGTSAGDSLEPSIPKFVNGATLSVLVPRGTVARPSGLVLSGNLLYVTDASSDVIRAFDLSGRLVQSLRTGLAAGAITGITAGPDGKAYFLDGQSASVYRIDVN